MLLVRRDVAGWRALLPEKFSDIVTTATFYLSMARMNLPAYFAHNPLWKIFYVVMLVLLVIEAFTGILLESAWLRSVFRTDTATLLEQHRMLLEPLGYLVIAHVVTALLHDWKTSTGELSAIVNGHKCFTVEQRLTEQNVQPVTVSLEGLKKTGKKNQ